MKKFKSPNLKLWRRTPGQIAAALLVVGCSTTGGDTQVPFSIKDVQSGAVYPGESLELRRDALKSAGDSQKQADIIERVSDFYTVNPSYRALAQALTQSGFSSAAYSLEAKKLTGEAHSQSRLPQVRPDVSLDQDGKAVGRLLFEQLLIGSGRLRAETLILNAQEAQALAEYRIEANDDMAKGFSAYLNVGRYKTLTEESADIVKLYESFLEKADARVRGGVANRNEARLFELKTAQAKAQHLEFAAEYERYKAQLVSLTGGRVLEEKILGIEFSGDASRDDALPASLIVGSPVYQLHMAMLDQSIGEAVQEKVSRRAELSLTGSLGAGSALGLGSDNTINNVRLGLTVSKPIVWGKDKSLKAFEANVDASEADVMRKIREIGVELKALNELLTSYERQLVAKKSVADLADQRAASFEGDFKAGAVSIVEAVSVLETVKTVKLDYIDLKFLVLEAELLKAQTLGILGPYTENPPVD